MGLLNIFQQLRNSKSLKVYWTGLVPTLWRDVPFSAIYWTLYEYSRKRYFSQQSNFWEHFFAGALSGSIAALLTNPFDVIKTRSQMDIFNTQNVSFLKSTKDIYKEEGFGSFFKGFLPRAARVAPACAVMISCYEVVKKRLRKRKEMQ